MEHKVSSLVYRCTCGVEVRGYAAALRHSKQGYRTQREAFYARELHGLILVSDKETGK